MIPKNILFIYGTRPEAIKLAPLIVEFKKNNLFNVKVCVTAQHREMMDQVNDFFDIIPDYDLGIMKKSQDLFDITSNVISKIKPVLYEFKPELIFIQGDTTTVLAGALAGYYQKIKIAHIEAGLRTDNIYSPFPEEGNRRLTSVLATFHFVPTQEAKENLLKENIKDRVYKVGNTVIDALFLTLKKVNEDKLKYEQYFDFISLKKKIILVTSHRRESFGKPLENICNAILKIVRQNKGIQIVYPVHLNPNVRSVVFEKLSGKSNIFLVEPLEYPYLVWLMNKSYFVLTDSGGIQEEAPSLGKPVLVLRDVTERMEGVNAGVAKLVGTSETCIFDSATLLLNDDEEYNRMSRSINPYGDGNSSQAICDIVVNTLSKEIK